MPGAQAVARNYKGWRQISGSTTTDIGVYARGQRRLDVGNASLATEGAVSGSILFGTGTSTTPAASATASIKFNSFYVSGSAASGSIEGLYYRAYATGAGTATLNAARIFASVSDVQITNARGAHISLSFGTSGTVTGLGSALTATLHIPNSATQAGTLTAVNAEINSDGATSDPAGATSLSYIRVANSGNTTGALDVDTDAVLLDFNGSSHTAGSGSLLDATASAATGDATIKIRWSDGTTKYLLVADDPN